MIFNPLRYYKYKKMYRTIKNSELFDPKYYLFTYTDVRKADIHPIKHYIKHGAKEGRNPNKYFDTKYYLNKYKDVKDSGVNPLFHYIKYGVNEGRNPNKYFDTKYYLEKYQDVKENGMNPLLHYIKHGENKGRETQYSNQALFYKEKIYSLNLFDEKYYLENNPDLKNKHIDPFDHYFTKGWIEGKKPSNKYDFDKYIKAYKDVQNQRINPILHYIQKGQDEGRQLFLYDEYIEQINQKENINLSVSQYNNYKLRRGKSNTAIYIVSLNENENIENPEIIDPDIDYICFSLYNIKENKNNVWEYRIITYHLDDLEKLDIFYTYSSNILLPEYINTIWIKNINYLTKIKINKIKSLYCDTNIKFAVGGMSEQVNDDIYSNSCKEVVKKLSLNNNSKYFIKPNFIYRNKTDLNIELFFNLWWFLTIKYNLSLLLPKEMIKESLDCIHIEEIGTTKVVNTSIDEYKKDIYSNFSKTLGCKLPLKKYQQRLSNTKVTIIITIFNALEDVKECLKSIEKSTFENFDVILADDCSKNEVVKWLENYTLNKNHISLLKTKENLGYTKNINRAISVVNSDYIILLNSDTIVEGNWIEKLLICYFDDSKVGIVGPLSNAASWQSAPHLRNDNSIPSYLNISKINNYLEYNSLHPYYPISDIVNGFCMCISNDVLKKVGKFDEKSFPFGYGEEDDFCMKARHYGFKNIICTSTYVFHSKSKSFGHERRIKLATEGRKILDSKYGKDGYKLLTDSIGNNPILNTTKDKLKSFYANNKPYSVTLSELGEEIAHIGTNSLDDNYFSGNICVHLHLHYIEMAKYFSDYISNIPVKFDLILTINDKIEEDKLKSIFQEIKNINIIQVYRYENKGRDILPLIKSMQGVYKNYDYLLHIHSKKSKHNSLGNMWLDNMMNSLLYNQKYISNLLHIMDNSNVGLIFAPIIDELKPNYKWGKNFEQTKMFLNKIGVNADLINTIKLSFPAGNMFWAKTKSLEKLFLSNLDYNDFPDEPIDTDGTLAHAIERSLNYIVHDAGDNSLIVKPQNKVHYLNERRMLKNRLISTEQVERLILESIKLKKPFALIRYYDGEGAFYKIEKRNKDYQQERMEYYFGVNNYSESDIEKIKYIIVNSLNEADVIGIPNLDLIDEMLNFTEQLSDNKIDKLPYIKKRYNKDIDCNSVWRIISSLQLTINALTSDKVFCTKDIHYNMILSGALYRILDQLDFVTIITSQPVKTYLEDLFNIKVEQYSIPKRALDNTTLNYTNHFPDTFNKIIKSLNRDLSGMFFLVGAGPLGKEYCAKIKSHGGIALDIGAVFDSWVNFHSRPEHCSADSHSIHTDLLLTSDNIRKLTSNKVHPKKEVTVNNLPNHTINQNLKNRYSK